MSCPCSYTDVGRNNQILFTEYFKRVVSGLKNSSTALFGGQQFAVLLVSLGLKIKGDAMIYGKQKLGYSYPCFAPATLFVDCRTPSESRWCTQHQALYLMSGSSQCFDR